MMNSENKPVNKPLNQLLTFANNFSINRVATHRCVKYYHVFDCVYVLFTKSLSEIDSVGSANLLSKFVEKDHLGVNRYNISDVNKSFVIAICVTPEPQTVFKSEKEKILEGVLNGTNTIYILEIPIIYEMNVSKIISEKNETLTKTKEINYDPWESYLMLDLKEENDYKCARCYKIFNNKLIKCDKCEMIEYCSAECQTAHYKTHSLTCLPVKKIVCEYCRKIHNTKLKKCFLAFYCSTECEEAHWKLHKKTCDQKQK